MAAYAKYSEMSPQWRAFEDRFPRLRELDKVDIVHRRQIFTEVEAELPPRQTPSAVQNDTVQVREFHLTARDGHRIAVRSYIPAAQTPPMSRPVVVYLHAGGFLFGDLESGDLNCRALASALDVSVLNVGYRLAPRWPFPHGVHDAYDAVKWASANAASQLAASSSAGLIIGGISSGANFAAVVAYQARDANLSPPVTGLWLSVPLALMPKAHQFLPEQWRSELLSPEQNADNPLLTKTSMAQIEEAYGAPPSSPDCSFLLNSVHTGMPTRMYIQVCGRDPLRDEAFLWQKLLYQHSGTESLIHMYHGLPHGFWRFRGMRASDGWLEDLVEGIQFTLGREAKVNDLGNAREETEKAEGAVIVVKGL